jgi:ADP-heptose:LPS heptosyltransferase
MTVPVISEMLNSHPSLKISILTKKHFTPLYSHLDKVNVIGVDFQSEYRGLLGLLKLSKKIKDFKC